MCCRTFKIHICLRIIWTSFLPNQYIYCLYMFICAPLATSWNAHNLVQLARIQRTMMLMMMLIIMIELNYCSPKRPHADVYGHYGKNKSHYNDSYLSLVQYCPWGRIRESSNKIMKRNQLCCCGIHRIVCRYNITAKRPAPRGYSMNIRNVLGNRKVYLQKAYYGQWCRFLKEKYSKREYSYLYCITFTYAKKKTR